MAPSAIAKRNGRIVLALVVAALLLPMLLAACPLCADAKSDADYGGGSASLPHGFYYSILFMVTVPFAVVGTFLLRLYLARRRSRSLPSGESAPVEPPPPLVAEPGGARS